VAPRPGAIARRRRNPGDSDNPVDGYALALIELVRGGRPQRATFRSETGTEIDDHIIDAAICGLVEPAARLEGSLLAEEMALRLKSRGVAGHHISGIPPAARYVLVRLPAAFEVRIEVVHGLAATEHIVGGL
jgi:hypothetical protein